MASLRHVEDPAPKLVAVRTDEEPLIPLDKLSSCARERLGDGAIVEVVERARDQLVDQFVEPMKPLLMGLLTRPLEGTGKVSRLDLGGKIVRQEHAVSTD